MVCIYCAGPTRVINSRPQKRLNQIWRRRQCERCRAIYTSIETADYYQALRVQHGKATFTPFVREKLLLSLHTACGHRTDPISDAMALTATVMSTLPTRAKDTIITRGDIIDVVMGILNNFDKAAAISYQAYHPL